MLYEEDQGWDWSIPTAVQDQPEFIIVEHTITVGGPIIEPAETDSAPNSPVAGSPVADQSQPSPGSSLGPPVLTHQLHLLPPHRQ